MNGVDIAVLIMVALAVVLAIGAGILATIAWRRSATIKRQLSTFLPDGAFSGEDIAAVLDALARHVRTMEDSVADLRLADDGLAQQLARKLGMPHVHRFNAFADVGGNLSFAMALLDEEGDGVVLSGIQGREQSRVYTKQVRRGRSDNPLSPEEKRVIAEAGMAQNREN